MAAHETFSGDVLRRVVPTSAPTPQQPGMIATNARMLEEHHRDKTVSPAWLVQLLTPTGDHQVDSSRQATVTVARADDSDISSAQHPLQTLLSLPHCSQSSTPRRRFMTTAAEDLLFVALEIWVCRFVESALLILLHH